MVVEVQTHDGTQDRSRIQSTPCGIRWQSRRRLWRVKGIGYVQVARSAQRWYAPSCELDSGGCRPRGERQVLPGQGREEESHWHMGAKSYLHQVGWFDFDT